VNQLQRDRTSAKHLGRLELSNLAESEIEGGIFLSDLPEHTVLRILTRNRCYTAVTLGSGEALISGHPKYCPEPVQVVIIGSTWGGSMLKLNYVGRGMHLEFSHPEFRSPIITSPIEEICESSPPPHHAALQHG
jgi:hypothetical protein